MATQRAIGLGEGIHMEVENAVREEAEIRVAVTEDSEKGKLDPKSAALLNNPQLNRKRITERLQMECKMLDNAIRFNVFIIGLLLFLFTVTTYDPTSTINNLHRNLRERFKFGSDGGPQTCNTPNDVMQYVQFFINNCYEMSSALVDANTFEDIDLSRCFSPYVDDVCRLNYWTIPLNRGASNYLNPDQLHDDKLAPDNAPSVVMDCDVANPLPNCINRSSPIHLAPNATKRTFGLTPEDPIILDSKMDYPLGSVLPLAPIVWQTRGKVVDCSGFGDAYNLKILGAGQCSASVTCDPERVTEFYNTQRNLVTGRKQSLFVTYIEDAFRCQNEWEDSTEYSDRSWSPWASRDKLTKGAKLSKGVIKGEQVWYKFISDVVYLQAPTATYVRSNRSLINDMCNPDEVLCDPSAQTNCVDPLEDPDHPMWTEINNHEFQCSFHDHWSRKFLSLSRERADYQNTFFTFETKTFVIAAVIITPFSANYPDIATLVIVEFQISQAGLITSTSEIVSTSETLEHWYRLAEVTVGVFLLIYIPLSAISFRTHNWHTSEKKVAMFDIILALCSAGCVTSIYLVDRFPPDVTKELIEALKENTQEAYFNGFSTIMSYQQTSQLMRDIGFVVALALFFRLNIFLAIHPRLAVLARTLSESAIDIVHFMIYLGMILAFLLCIGWWSFGMSQEAYATLPMCMYRLFRMFTGDSLFDFVGIDQDQPPDFKLMLYLIIFVFLIFFILLNFFLAIIVNAYTEVQERGHNVELTDNTCFWDIADTCRNMYHYLRGQWPFPHVLQRYFESKGRGKHEPSSVTAEELFNCVERKEKPAFANLQAAEHFVKVYMRKVRNGNENVIEEYRLGRMFPKGKYWNPVSAEEEHEEENHPRHESQPKHNSEDALLETVDDISRSLRKVHEDLKEIREKECSDSVVPDETPIAGTLQHKGPHVFPEMHSIGDVNSATKSHQASRSAAKRTEISTAAINGNLTLQEMKKHKKVLEAELVESRAQVASMKIFAEKSAHEALTSAMNEHQITHLQGRLRELNSELSLARARLKGLQNSSSTQTQEGNRGVLPANSQHDELVERQLNNQIMAAQMKAHATAVEVDMIKTQRTKLDQRLQLLEHQKDSAESVLNGLKLKLATSRLEEERLRTQIHTITGSDPMPQTPMNTDRTNIANEWL